MGSFTYRMPAGIPGGLSRGAGQATVEPQAGDAAKDFLGYGMFGKIVAEKFVPLEVGDVAGVIYGLLLRPFPTGASQDGLGTSTPPTSGGILDVLRRGYATVALAGATAAAKNGQVYVRTTVGAGETLGTIEAAADGGDCVAVAGCFFTGPADANGIVEVAYNI
jgi:hypothetical protein